MPSRTCTRWVGGRFFDLFPEHENRETEVHRGFRFFVSGWGETKKLT